ncbi:MAG: NADH-quinone oxidoreductase subunit C, partial [Acidimicrobiales bacterium]
PAPAVVAEQPPAPPGAQAQAALDAEVEAATLDKEAQAEAAPGPARAVPGTAQAEAGGTDQARQTAVDELYRHLGDALVASHVVPGRDVWVRVRPEAWRRAVLACRDGLGMTYLSFLSALDWLPSPFGRGQDGGAEEEGAGSEPPARPAELEHGYTGGESRIQVFARLLSVTSHLGVTLKADVPDDGRIESLVEVFPGADWHEREAWEMYGIDFVGHPNLAHIYLPGGFEGHPLRKDFPLLSRHVKPWPGLVDVEAMPGENGPGENGPGENGPGEDGPGENGPGENGPGEDGPGEVEDAEAAPSETG